MKPGTWDHESHPSPDHPITAQPDRTGLSRAWLATLCCCATLAILAVVLPLVFWPRWVYRDWTYGGFLTGVALIFSAAATALAAYQSALSRKALQASTDALRGPQLTFSYGSASKMWLPSPDAHIPRTVFSQVGFLTNAGRQNATIVGVVLDSDKENYGEFASIVDGQLVESQTFTLEPGASVPFRCWFDGGSFPPDLAFLLGDASKVRPGPSIRSGVPPPTIQRALRSLPPKPALWAQQEALAAAKATVPPPKRRFRTRWLRRA